MSDPLPPNQASGEPLPYATPQAFDYAADDVASDPGNPWFAIWLHPKLVMRWVLANDATRWVPGLIAGGAAVNAVSRVGEGVRSVQSLATSIAISLVVGTAIGFLVSYYLAPWLLTVIGRWLGGTGDRVRLRAAIAYAQIPTIWSALLLLPAIALLAFLLLFPPATGNRAASPAFVAILGLGLGQLVIAVWSIVVGLACIAVAHRFSMWRALGTLVILFAIVFALVLAIVMPAFLLISRGR